MNQPPIQPIIPNEYVVRTQRDDMGGQRTITVRKYSTTIDFEREKLLIGIARSGLVFGREFGIIESYDVNNPERNIRLLCGLVGERNLVLLNQFTNKPDFFRIKNVLLATIMVEFSADSESKKLELLIYGGKQGYTEFWRMMKDNFEIDVENVTSRIFSDNGLRSLCENFFDRLHQITIDPWYKDGWGTIKAAAFKSSRGQFINPNVDRMKQVLENKDIRISSFKSMLSGQTLMPELENAYDIKFHVLKDSGISPELPEFQLPETKSDLAHETVLYDLARQTYRRIIGDDELFEAVTSDGNKNQMELTLFD